MKNDDDEWFSTQFSPDELKQQYTNDMLDKYRREHAFYRYWKPRISESDIPFTEDDVSEMLSYATWSATATLIGEIARRQRFTYMTTLRLQKIFAQDSWCGQQLAALVIFQDNNILLRSKINDLLLLGAHEFIQKLPEICKQDERWIKERLEKESLSKKQRKAYAEWLEKVKKS